MGWLRSTATTPAPTRTTTSVSAPIYQKETAVVSSWGLAGLLPVQAVKIKEPVTLLFPGQKKHAA
jgi:hypothetical protein